MLRGREEEKFVTQVPTYQGKEVPLKQISSSEVELSFEDEVLPF